MESIKNIALAGATGFLGSHILEALVASERYSLTILTSSPFPNHSRVAKAAIPVKVLHVDYESFNSLRRALEGQDVLISVLGKPALAVQPRLIDAAVAAHVKRIIPSEFGGDLRNPIARQFPTYQPKVEVEEQLERYRAKSDTSYTFIFNNVLLDWALTQGLLMDPQTRTIRVYDGGDVIFSTTCAATVGRAVVAVLDKYHETANRAVYIHDTAITQNELVAMAMEATKDDRRKSWTVKAEDTAQLEHAAHLDLEQGVSSPSTFYGFAVRAAIAKGYGGHFQNLDNELLGIPEMDRNEVQDIVRTAVMQKV